MTDRRKNSEILVLCELQRQNKMACGAKRPCVPNHFCKRLRTWVWFSLLEIVDLSTAVIRLYNRVHSFSRCDDNMFRAAHRHLPNFAQFRCSFRFQNSASCKSLFVLQIVCRLPFLQRFVCSSADKLSETATSGGNCRELGVQEPQKSGNFQQSVALFLRVLHRYRNKHREKYKYKFNHKYCNCHGE